MNAYSGHYPNFNLSVNLITTKILTDTMPRGHYNPKVRNIGHLMAKNAHKEMVRRNEEMLRFGRRFEGRVKRLERCERDNEALNERYRVVMIEAQQRRRHMERHDVDLRWREAEIRHKRESWKERGDTIETREKALGTGEKALERREKALEKKEKEFKARDEQLRKKMEFYEDEEGFIHEKWVEVHKKADRMADLSRQLEERLGITGDSSKVVLQE